MLTSMLTSGLAGWLRDTGHRDSFGRKNAGGQGNPAGAPKGGAPKGRGHNAEKAQALALGESKQARRGMRFAGGLGLFFVLGFGVGGCGPGAELEGLPAPAVAWLEVDRATTQAVAEGVRLHQVRSRRAPWSLHVLEVDLSQCEVGFRVARGGDGAQGGRRLVQEFLRDAAAQGVAALNGDFYTEADLPIGIDASEGSLRGRSSRPVFAWRPGEGIYLGPVQWSGDTLRVGDWDLVRGEPDGRTELVSGFPALLSGGAWVGDLELEDRPTFAGERHPRTALGWDPLQNRLWAVVADGRREGIAEGMTLPELAELFMALGATEALNLDGGGSSVLVVRGRVASRPSDPGGARPVANALVVLEDPALCANR